MRSHRGGCIHCRPPSYRRDIGIYLWAPQINLPWILRDACLLKVIRFITHHNTPQKHFLSPYGMLFWKYFKSPILPQAPHADLSLPAFLLTSLLVDPNPLPSPPPLCFPPSTPLFPHHKSIIKRFSCKCRGLRDFFFWTKVLRNPCSFLP